MASQVVKSDGSKVPFDPDKIRKAIEGAAADAGVSAADAAPVVNQVMDAVLPAASGKDEISTAELKALVLGELDKVRSEFSAAWRKYDETKGK